jgi:hypothetical protein
LGQEDFSNHMNIKNILEDEIHASSAELICDSQRVPGIIISFFNNVIGSPIMA